MISKTLNKVYIKAVYIKAAVLCKTQIISALNRKKSLNINSKNMKFDHVNLKYVGIK